MVNDRIPMKKSRTPRNVRSSCHDVAKLEWVIQFPGSDQPTRVCDIGHEGAPMLIRDRSKLSVIPVPWISGGTTNDQSWFIYPRLGGQSSVVDQTGISLDAVREGLEVN